MNWLKRLLGIKNKTLQVEPTVDPPIHIAPDPDMQPGWWAWECIEPGCETGGTGPDQLMRQSSMMHCLNTGHSVMGNYVGD